MIFASENKSTSRNVFHIDQITVLTDPQLNFLTPCSFLPQRTRYTLYTFSPTDAPTIVGHLF